MNSIVTMKRFIRSAYKQNPNQALRNLTTALDNFKELSKQEQATVNSAVKKAYEALKAKGVVVKKAVTKAKTAVKGTDLRSILKGFKAKVGLDKYREGTRGTDIERDMERPALKKGKRKVTTKGKTSNQFGTFKNKIGKVYYESRANRMDVNQPSKYRTPKLADGGNIKYQNDKNYQFLFQSLEANLKSLKRIFADSEMTDITMQEIQKIQDQLKNRYGTIVTIDDGQIVDIKSYAKGGKVAYAKGVSTKSKSTFKYYKVPNENLWAIQECNASFDDGYGSNCVVIRNKKSEDEAIKEVARLNAMGKHDYYAKGGQTSDASKFWDSLSSQEKSEWLKKRKDIPSDYKTSLKYDSFAKLPEWIKEKVNKAFAQNKIYRSSKMAKGGKVAYAKGGKLVGTETTIRFYGDNLKYIKRNNKVYEPLYFYSTMKKAEEYAKESANYKPSEFVILPYENNRGKCFVIYREVMGDGGELKKKDNKLANGGSLDDARIYVADLAEYNNGRLVGKWLDLSDYSSGAEVMEEIQNILDEQTKKDKHGEVHEEYAIHDFEGFPRSFYYEYMGEADFDKLYAIMNVAKAQDLPIDVLMEAMSDLGYDDEAEKVAEQYFTEVDASRGNEWRDFAYEYVEMVGGIENISNADSYFDFKSYGKEIDDSYSDEELEEMGFEGLDNQELGEQFANSMGGVKNLGEETIESHFDYEKFGRELKYDFISVRGEDGHYYFFRRNFAKGGQMKYAKGGMTEHGLQSGDKIIQNFANAVVVENEGKKYVVNLNSGKRFTDIEWFSMNKRESAKMQKMADGGEVTNEERQQAMKQNLKLKF